MNKIFSVSALILVISMAYCLRSDMRDHLTKSSHNLSLISSYIKEFTVNRGEDLPQSSLYFLEKDVQLPEIKTLRATIEGPSKVMLEGRIEKFEYKAGPKPLRTGDKEFRGGVLVKNGRIVLVPRTGKFICEYDPETNTILQTAEHGQEGGFGMGVVLDDGYTVIFTPRGSRNVGIYDAKTKTYRNGASHGIPSDNAFLGCVKVSPELIVFGPLHSKVVGLYNPKTDTYKDGPAHNEADTYNFSVITRSSLTGNVIFTPFNSRHVGIYNPLNNTYTSGAAHNANVTSAFSGSVELENGHIIMPPRDASFIGIYDPVANSFIKGPEHGEAKGAFMEAEMMPDGEVIMAAFRSDHIGIYEHSIGEYRSGPYVGNVPGAEIGRFSSAVLTQSKEMIVMTNRDADVIGLVQNNQFFRKGRQAEVFFHYRKKGESNWIHSESNKVYEHGIFKMVVNNLTPNQEYEYRFVIRYKKIEREGKTMTFRSSSF